MVGDGRYQEAEELALSLTVRFPLWGTGWKALGVALKQLGRSEDALKPMQSAVALSPNDAESHTNLSALLQDLGRLREAESSCQRALAIDPLSAVAHNNLGVILLERGPPEAAEASFRRALEIRPDSAAAYFNLHAVLLNADDLNPALECLEKSVEIDPANEERRFFLGMLFDYIGNSRRAASHFEAVENGANLSRARLDAWRYLKSTGGTLPRITGSRFQAFKLGIGMAINTGLVLEFGVRFGSSIRQIAALANQRVHGFDSFEGLPEQWHDEPKGSYSTKGVLPKLPENVRLHAGWFEDTLPEFLKRNPGPVRFMNIDCDIYRSTKTVLGLLSDRIVANTVIVFDEYIGNEHWRDDEFKAFQEAVVRYGWHYEYVSFSFFTKQVVVRIV